MALGYWCGWGRRTNDLPFTLSGLPQVFTRFRHQIEKQLPPMQACPAPEYVPSLPCGVDQRLGVDVCLADLGLEPLPLEPRTSIPYQGGEAAASLLSMPVCVS